MTVFVAQPTTADLLRRKVEGVRLVLEKVVRIIASRRVRMFVPDSHNMGITPGWTDGADIFLNGAYIQSVLAGQPTREEFRELVMRLKGVTYHELSHILFTPRNTDDLPKRVIQAAQTTGDSSWWYALNGLEDQRIETLFTATYRPAMKFFEAAVLEWLIKNPDALERAHVLTHGRMYLSTDIRRKARVTFCARYGTDLAVKFETVIEKYLTVLPATHSNAAWDCVREYHDLLQQMQAVDSLPLPPQPTEDNDPRGKHGGSASEGVIRHGDATKKEQREAADQAGKQQKSKAKQNEADKAEAEDADDGSGDQQDDQDEDQPFRCGDLRTEAETDGESYEGDSNGEGDGKEGDAEGESKGDDGDQPDTSNTTTDDVSVGTGDGTPTETDEDALLKAAEELLEAAMQDGDLRAELEATVDAIQKSFKSDDGVGGDYAPHVDHPVPGDVRQLTRNIVTAMKQLQLELENEREFRQLSGRLNMRRVMSSEDHEIDVFDAWDDLEGDIGGVEAVILLDLSGSMSHIMATASQAMYAVKSAFDQLDIKTTVLGFSSHWYALYKRGEKAARPTFRLYHTIGGTDGLPALTKAHELLVSSDRPNRVLVSITDGGWSEGEDELHPVMASMHAANVTSLLICLGSGMIGRFGRHHHQVAHEMNDIKDVPKAIAGLVKQIMVRAHKHGSAVG